MSFESVPSRARLFYHNLLISQTALGKVKKQKSKGKRARGQGGRSQNSRLLAIGTLCGMPFIRDSQKPRWNDL